MLVECVWKPQNKPASAAASTSILALHAPTAQCIDLKANLMLSIKKLKTQNQIFGPLLTINELINPLKKQVSEDDLQILNNDNVVA